MHSSRLELPMAHSWPRLGAATQAKLRSRLTDRGTLLLVVGVCALLAIGWFSVERQGSSVGENQLLALLPQSERAIQREQAVAEAARLEAERARLEAERAAAIAAAQRAEAEAIAAPATMVPDRRYFERYPSTHLPIDADVPTRIRVVTIRAKVTGYTAYDHRYSRPEWADGVVAWHPGGRKRRVTSHPYGFATDWAQFPPGATFINVPGYLERTYPDFPQRFMVVDDACGAARKARRRGAQPVIDVRFRNRSSIIGGDDSWGTRQLDVEVVFPAGYAIPSSLRRWVVSEEWRTYHKGARVD